MVKKWMNYGLLIICLLLVIAFIGLEVIPAKLLEKVWTKQQGDFIESVIMWCTIGFGLLLAVYIVIGQLANRGRSNHSEAVVQLPQPQTEPHSWFPAAADKNAIGSAAAEAAELKEEAHSHSLTEVIPGNAQHIGAREEQQDAFGFSALNDPESVKRFGMLAVLADGMGGLAMGKEASRLAVQTMLNVYTEKLAEEPVSQALEKALHQANKEVYELSLHHELEWNVGTTLIAAVILEGQLFWISVGDSRIYLYRGGVLVPLTRDHVYANQLYERVKAGQLTREEAESHPERHLLTSYLGIPRLDEIDANRIPLRLAAGDWVLLCSDGLYDELSESLLEEAVRMPPQLAAEFILQHVLALQKPYQDNATIAILACS